MQNKTIVSLAFIMSLSQLSACGGSDGDDGSDGPVIPKNAIIFSEENAVSSLETAITDNPVSDFVGGIEESNSLNSGKSLSILMRKLDDIKSYEGLMSGYSSEVVSAVSFSESEACSGGGDWSVSGGGGVNQGSYTVKLSNCIESGMKMNGSILGTWKESGDDEIITSSGSISMTDIEMNLTLSITRLAYKETYNWDTDAYTLHTLSFTYDTALGQGFAFNTSPALIGIYGSCPTSGAQTISGSNGTQARATFVDGTVVVEINTGDGVFTEVETVSCTGWEYW